MQRLALLLCSCLFVLALPASAKDKSHGSSHHYNPRYNSHSSNNGHSNGRANGHSNSRSNHGNFKQYNPGYGYYQGYYNDYPVYENSISFFHSNQPALCVAHRIRTLFRCAAACG